MGAAETAAAFKKQLAGETFHRQTVKQAPQDPIGEQARGDKAGVAGEEMEGVTAG